MINKLIDEVMHLCLDSVEVKQTESGSEKLITITDAQKAKLSEKYMVFSKPPFDNIIDTYTAIPSEMTMSEFKESKNRFEEHISQLISEFVEQNRGVADVSKIDVHIYSREIPADVDVEIQMTI